MGDVGSKKNLQAYVGTSLVVVGLILTIWSYNEADAIVAQDGTESPWAAMLYDFAYLGMILVAIGIGLVGHYWMSRSEIRLPNFKRIEPVVIQGKTNFCRGCGHSLAVAMTKCPSCGLGIDGPTAGPLATSVDVAFCSNCGHAVVAGATECLWCGSIVRR